MSTVSREEQEALREWQAEVAQYVQGELTAATREYLRMVLERTLETELTQQLGSERYGRSATRCDWRNGHRQRDLVTELGLLTGLKVPRTRHGSYQPQVFLRYARRQPLVNQLIREMFVAGVATRRVGEVLGALLGDRPSATTVSRICKELDARVRAFHARPVEDRWPFLVLDGVWMHVKSASGLKKRVVLAVYGMDAEGRKQLLDFLLADSESEAAWTALLQSLYQRGLKGEKLELVITDGAPGMIAALQFVYPQARHQRCWVHKLWNLSRYVRKADQKALKHGAQEIYLAPTRREAIRVFRRWRQRWLEIYPKAVACLEKDLEALLAHLDYPAHLRAQLRTTNALERAFREVRRRIRPMSAFTNDASCERITYALVMHLNSQWSRKPKAKSTHKS